MSNPREATTNDPCAVEMNDGKEDPDSSDEHPFAVSVLSRPPRGRRGGQRPPTLHPFQVLRIVDLICDYLDPSADNIVAFLDNRLICRRWNQGVLDHLYTESWLPHLYHKVDQSIDNHPDLKQSRLLRSVQKAYGWNALAACIIVPCILGGLGFTPAVGVMIYLGSIWSFMGLQMVVQFCSNKELGNLCMPDFVVRGILAVIGLGLAVSLMIFSWDYHRPYGGDGFGSASNSSSGTAPRLLNTEEFVMLWTLGPIGLLLIHVGIVAIIECVRHPHAERYRVAKEAHDALPYVTGEDEVPSREPPNRKASPLVELATKGIGHYLKWPKFPTSSQTSSPLPFHRLALIAGHPVAHYWLTYGLLRRQPSSHAVRPFLYHSERCATATFVSSPPLEPSADASGHVHLSWFSLTDPSHSTSSITMEDVTKHVSQDTPLTSYDAKTVNPFLLSLRLAHCQERQFAERNGAFILCLDAGLGSRRDTATSSDEISATAAPSSSCSVEELAEYCVTVLRDNRQERQLAPIFFIVLVDCSRPAPASSDTMGAATAEGPKEDEDELADLAREQLLEDRRNALSTRIDDALDIPQLSAGDDQLQVSVLQQWLAVGHPPIHYDAWERAGRRDDSVIAISATAAAASAEGCNNNNNKPHVCRRAAQSPVLVMTLKQFCDTVRTE